MVTTAVTIVSAIVVCYNQQAYIADALDSVGNQSLSDFEIIIIDDASDDGSSEIIERWVANHTVRPLTSLRNERNRGVCASINRAASLARGTYLSLIAGDDRWLPEKLQIQVARLEALGEEWALTYGDSYQIDENGTRLPGTYSHVRQLTGSQASGGVFAELVDMNFIPSMATLFRRSAFNNIGGCDERLVFEDVDLWLRLARHWKVDQSLDVLSEYRLHNDSLASRLHETNELWLSYLQLKLKCYGFSIEVDRCLDLQIRQLLQALVQTPQLTVAAPLLQIVRVRRSRRIIGALVEYGLALRIPNLMCALQKLANRK